MANPNKIKLTVAVVQTSIGAVVKRGMCTGYLEDVYKKHFAPEVSEAMPFYIRGFLKESLFGVPSSTTVPLIMIGPGCGVAPFIGYIEEREYLLKNNKEIKYGPMELYFGCRKREKDFIYAKELHEWKSTGVLTGLNIAFSRDQEKRIHVQDLIKKDREKLYKYIKDQEGIIHVCGSLVMGEAVKKAILNILEVGESNPEAYFEVLKKSGRLIAELWG